MSFLNKQSTFWHLTKLHFFKELESLRPEIETVFAIEKKDYRNRSIGAKEATGYLSGGQYRWSELSEIVFNIANEETRILNIGIAFGLMDILLKEKANLNITGMELKENIPVYCRLALKHGVTIIPGELAKSPSSIPDSSYDLIIFSEVIEHLRISPFRALNEIKRMLVPGGTLILTTPNIAKILNMFRLLIGRNIIGEFPDDDTGLNHVTDRLVHIREYTMNELKDLFRRTGYEIESAYFSAATDRIHPMWELNWKWRCLLRVFYIIGKVLPQLRGLLVVIARKAI